MNKHFLDLKSFEDLHLIIQRNSIEKIYLITDEKDFISSSQNKVFFHQIIGTQYIHSEFNEETFYSQQDVIRNFSPDIIITIGQECSEKIQHFELNSVPVLAMIKEQSQILDNNYNHLFKLQNNLNKETNLELFTNN